MAAVLLGLSAQSAAAALSGFPSNLLLALGQHNPPPSLVFSYHGFQIDASAAQRQEAPERTVKALQRQVDLVEHVGLTPEILASLRTNRVLADPSKTGEADRYVPGQGVVVNVTRLDPKRPILLTGLLKAYHEQRLSSGVLAGDVDHYRLEALTRHDWPKGALMLRSDSDFFALTSAAYLYGAITWEPYSRAKLRRTQPGYCRWLASLFDGGKARA